jgi:hypothetical protein
MHRAYSLSLDRLCRYCVRLEQQLWTQYRRDASVVPLLISLPAAKDAAKAAVAERLVEVGLTPLALSDPEKQWVIILDGYDEVQGGSNFVVGNRLDVESRVKVIVSCRTEYLEGKGAYRGLFTPGGTSGDTEGLKELYVRPFEESQVAAYFQHWASRPSVEVGEETVQQWSADRYLQVIKTTPGLPDLAQTPFVLRAMADALPRLDAPAHRGGRSGGDHSSGGDHASEGSSRRITRANVYEAFVAQCWEVATRRLRRNWPRELSPDYDAPLSYYYFSMDLAVNMLARGQVGVVRLLLDQ